MEKTAILILPNQLFEKLDILENISEENTKIDVYLIEHPNFFINFNYHNMKQVYHRATMKYYFDFINKKYKKEINKFFYKFFYIDLKNSDNTIKKIFKTYDKINIYDPVDHEINKSFVHLAKKYKKELKITNTQLFYETSEDIENYIREKNIFINNSWYIWIRRKKNILVDKDGKPIGGKWSFDKENRNPYPKDLSKIPEFKPKFYTNKYISEAQKYISKTNNTFGNNNIYLPITHKDTKKHFNNFLKKRMECFGPYQDAVHEKITIGCHSVISAMLNIGLITPEYVIKKTIEYYEKNKKQNRDILASVEGFLRQIIGWRSYMRILYIYKAKEFEKENLFGHKRKLDMSRWQPINKKENLTGIKPVDRTIAKVMEYAYAHHIERLMYLGNFMMLTETHPYDVYKWFMECFIDAYPWVMYGNVYGMSQHSAGTIMATRPYFSSSNYIDKMSSYKRETETNKINWNEYWDALYYNFIENNKKYLKSNYSTANAVSVWDKKSKKEKEHLLKLANEYLKKY